MGCEGKLRDSTADSSARPPRAVKSQLGPAGFWADCPYGGCLSVSELWHMVAELMLSSSSIWDRAGWDFYTAYGGEKGIPQSREAVDTWVPQRQDPLGKPEGDVQS